MFSYVYLGAIEGLGAVADVALGQVLPLLVKEYQNIKRPLETRLKIGEVLVHVARRLGAMLPSHASVFVEAYLPLFREADETLRASALSNLAELCEVLGFGLLPFVSTIMELILQLILVERQPQVRRGAVNAIYQLLIGLDEKIFQVIPDYLKV